MFGGNLKENYVVGLYFFLREVKLLMKNCRFDKVLLNCV